MYKVVVLTNNNQINEARRLVYQVYTSEGTIPSEDFKRCVGMKTVETDDGYMFMDDNDEKGIWVGAYDGNKMIGTGRMLHKGRLESSYLTEIGDTSCFCEFGRLVVMEQYRKSTAVYEIVRFMIGITNAMGLKILSCTSTPAVKYIVDNVLKGKTLASKVIGHKNFIFSVSEPSIAIPNIELVLRSKL